MKVQSPLRKESHHSEKQKEKPALLRSDLDTFDIKRDCLFCSEIIIDESKKPLKRRRVVSSVETLEFKDTVLNHATYRKDDWGDIVAGRLHSICDLLAAEGKYHRNCAQVFLQNRNETVGSRGRQPNT